VQQINYEKIIKDLDMEAVMSHVKFLSNLTTRATGYSGNEEAAQYIFDTFVNYGLKNVHFYNFSTVDAVSYGANITVISPTSMSMEIYPIVPNVVSPSTFPPGGVIGNLIYAKEGYLSDFDGKQVNGSIVLMDFNSRDRWINAANLGAKAVIFLPPLITVPEELQYKSIDLPLHFPRFWIQSQDANVLLELLKTGKPIQVRVESKVMWERLTGRNVIGVVQGTQYPDKYIMLTSYYDSYSIAPSIAPGAQEACGIAFLLELAKYFCINPPKYSLMFVAYGGHHQGLAGARALRDEYFYPGPSWDNIGKKIILQVNIDLSTGSDIPYFTFYGGFYALPIALDPSPYMPLLRYHSQIRDLINQQKPGGRTYMALDDSMGCALAWYMPTDTRWYSYESEVLINLILPGYTFTTVFDKRQYYMTPQDTLERFNRENLQTQLEYIQCFIYTLLNTENLEETHLRLFDYKGAHETGKLCKKIRGRVAQYSEKTGWYEPIPDVTPIVICERQGWTSKPSGAGGMKEAGVTIKINERYVQIPDSEGFFEFSGIYSHWVDHRLSIWVINSTTGHVTYALDGGPRQYASYIVQTHGYPTSVPEAISLGWLYCVTRDSDIDFGFVNLFECGSIFISDNIDPKSLANDPPPTWEVVDRDTYTPTKSYLVSRIGSMVMMFIPPRTPSLLLRGEKYPSAFIVNSSPTLPESGYTLTSGQQLIIKNAPLVFAKDLYHRNEEIIAILKSHEMTVKEAFEKHQRAFNCLVRAEEALNNMEYDKLYSYAVTAWKLENEVYLEIRPVMEDMAHAIPFFASLLIPFTFLLEKLLLSWDGMKRLVALIGIFGCTLGALTTMHPGFQIAASPIIVIIATSILILVSPILVVIASRIQELLKALREKYLGAHYAEISRMSAVEAAFFIGIGNMKRRKVRSSLVFLSVIIMVSGLVTLTSLSALKVSKVLPCMGNALYDGIYIHPASWGYEMGGPLSQELLNYIEYRYSDVAVLAPRAWHYTLDPGVAGAPNYHFWIHHQGNNITAYCLLGITDKESEVSGIDRFVAGRTFLPTDRNTMILTQKQAERLGITNTTLPAKVSMFGIEYTVVGIIDDNYDQFLVELDGEWITPLLLNIPDNPFNVHAPADWVIILPYWDVVSLGGTVRSVSLKFKDPNLIIPAAEELSLLLPVFTIYANQQGEISVYGAAQAFTVLGMEYQLVIMILIALIVLNIMIGNIYERKREISIYSSVGLSPLHVASMFLAESVMYAVVGGLLGYVIAMSMCKVGTSLALGILFLNYSSLWAMVGVGVSMLIIILSSIYPMVVSARLVTPSVERVWRIPTKPIGDAWVIPLPFTFEQITEVEGCLSYLEEFIRPHMIEGAEDFTVSELTLREGEMEGKRYKELVMMMALAPYEKGIHQTVSIAFIFEPKDNRWYFELRITRRSGVMETWLISNRNFADMIRKQLLMWISMSSTKKEAYIKRFKKIRLELAH